jgi:hypothetical protein
MAGIFDQKRSRNEWKSDPVNWYFREARKGLGGYGPARQFSRCSADIFENDYWSNDFRRYADDASRNTQGPPQFHPVYYDNRQFNADSGLSIEFGRIGGNARSFIRAKEKADLDGGNNGQQRGKDAQYESIEGDRVFPRSPPYRGDPLPEGFGWLVLVGAGFGAGAGIVYVLILAWLFNRPNKAAANGKTHDGRKERQN